MRIAALVPMKGHSERVPNKNLQLFDGKPLCEWILRTLINVEEIERIYVNTDSKEIAFTVTAVSDKIEVIDRPEQLRGDYVSMNRILEHDLQQTDAGIYMQTHATNPLLTANTIALALKAFRDGTKQKEHDSLFTATGYQTRFYRNDGTPVNHNPEELLPTQHLPILFEENSNLYIFTKESFSNTGGRMGKTPGLFEMNKIEAIDIDNWPDFHLAEAIKKSGILDNYDK